MGQNQAIRLKRDIELDANLVLFEKHGDVLTNRPRPRGLQETFASDSRLDPSLPPTSMTLMWNQMGRMREPGNALAGFHPSR